MHWQTALEDAKKWESPHPIYSMPDLEDLAPLERACFKVALEAHDGEWRNKPEPKPPYIIHPLIALKIAKLVGIKDWIVTGGICVHDTLEKSKDIESPLRKRIREGGRAELQKVIQEFAVPEVEPLKVSEERKGKAIKFYASAVARTVEEVTNSAEADQWIANKRLEQIQKTSRYSQRAKEYKMLDFASSLIDDIIIPPNKPPTGRRVFIKRARDVAKKCYDAHPVLGELVKTLCDINEAQLKLSPEAAKKEGKSFDLDDIVKKAKQNAVKMDGLPEYAYTGILKGVKSLLDSDIISIVGVEPDKTTPRLHGLVSHIVDAVKTLPKLDDSIWVAKGGTEEKNAGIVNVKIENGRVRKYRTVIDPDGENNVPANQSAWALVDRVEASENNSVDTGAIYINPDYQIVVNMKLRNPILVKHFLEAAAATHNISPEYRDRIVQSAAETRDAHRAGVQRISHVEALRGATNGLRVGPRPKR